MCTYFVVFTENIRNLISCLNDQQLANFCRILAVAISDLDIYENKSSCKYWEWQHSIILFECNNEFVSNLIVFSKWQDYDLGSFDLVKQKRLTQLWIKEREKTFQDILCRTDRYISIYEDVRFLKCFIYFLLNSVCTEQAKEK